MYIIIWKYTVKPEFTDEFIKYYNSDGVWAKFFEPDANYIGTDFYRGAGVNEFLTIDSWISEESYEAFKAEHKEKYLAIDKLCDNFTENEVFLGSYHDLD